MILSDGEVRAMSALALAHMGDAVYEILARREVCRSGKLTAGELHRQTIRYVSAPAQARAFPAQRVQRPGNSAVKAFPVRRQAYARRVADKQRKPEIFLKMPDMLADRRLGHAQFFPRSGEAAGSGRCLKGGKCIQGRGIKHKKNLS